MSNSLNLGDDRFSLVEWKGENGRLSVISMSQFIKTNNAYEEEKEYKVVWPADNKKYWAKLLLKGNC